MDNIPQIRSDLIQLAEKASQWEQIMKTQLTRFDQHSYVFHGEWFCAFFREGWGRGGGEAHQQETARINGLLFSLRQRPLYSLLFQDRIRLSSVHKVSSDLPTYLPAHIGSWALRISIPETWEIMQDLCSLILR